MTPVTKTYSRSSSGGSASLADVKTRPTSLRRAFAESFVASGFDAGTPLGKTVKRGLASSRGSVRVGWFVKRRRRRSRRT